MENKLQNLYLTDYNLLLSNLVNNLSEGIHTIKCKYRHNDTCRMKLAELNLRMATSFLNT